MVNDLKWRHYRGEATLWAVQLISICPPPEMLRRKNGF